MGKLRPYIALDLETTGLDTERSLILQVGYVIDDGVSPLAALEKGTFFIENPVIYYGENYALGMNAWIFQELMKKEIERKYPTKKPQQGLYSLMCAIEKAAILAEEFDKANGEKRPSRKVQLAGKNVGNFDWPIVLDRLEDLTGVESMHEHECNESAKEILPSVDHRFIDCGGIFFEEFGKNPGFNAINKLIGWKDINHDALDDAINVVVAIRYRMGMKE